MDGHWSADVYHELSHRDFAAVATVPSAALSPLLALCAEPYEPRLVTLTTEEEGIGLVTGLWAGGRRAMLAMQSSGVGNCVNALSLPAAMRAPCLMLVTMRGEWGEGNPWQVPMGQGTEPVLRAMGVLTYRAETAEDVAPTLAAAADLAWESRRTAAVLVSQRVTGAKGFGR
jgi:sulfopyruvate decarboxylase alpha subunit